MKPTKKRPIQMGVRYRFPVYVYVSVTNDELDGSQAVVTISSNPELAASRTEKGIERTLRVREIAG
ncbi:MAG: hypothetical protein JRN68_04900 [Nitrososphaerota archaeon]|nr:hypothetical protein [Nitrososphaerota archaeon]